MSALYILRVKLLLLTNTQNLIEGQSEIKNMRKRLRNFTKKLNTPKAATKSRQIQPDHGVQSTKAPVLSFKYNVRSYKY